MKILFLYYGFLIERDMNFEQDTRIFQNENMIIEYFFNDMTLKNNLLIRSNYAIEIENNNIGCFAEKLDFTTTFDMNFIKEKIGFEPTEQPTLILCKVNT
jgi:hypothetical protein